MAISAYASLKNHLMVFASKLFEIFSAVKTILIHNQNVFENAALKYARCFNKEDERFL